MEDLLLEILSQYGYPVMLQGSLAQEEDYPEHFFTYWENPGNEIGFYDNSPHGEVYDYDVNFYSTDVALAYKMPVAVKEQLVNNGFIVPGSGYSVGSDEVTHTGRGIHVIYQKRNQTGGK